MKKSLFLVTPIIISMLVCGMSCKKDKTTDNTTLGGDQSPMGNVGTTVSSTSLQVAGVSNFAATITALNNGVSTYSGSATVANAALLNLLANIPEITIAGNVVSTTSIKFKNTTEGIQFLSGPTQGVWANYNSSVGDTYPIGSTGKVRTVVSKSTTDDYSYGFYLIKVMQVEENTSFLKDAGVSKVTYWANHKFGLVGIQFSFNDGTSATFPVYTSVTN
jgi:hypothetical protein